MTAIAVIPARFASTRLPGKPLLRETGRPLIQHVVENARRCGGLSRVVVATDDRRIHDAVLAFGGESVMTGEHPNGTSRIAEVVEKLGLGEAPHVHAGLHSRAEPLIVNLQGDEPELSPAVVDALVAAMEADAACPMGTVATPFGPGEDPANPNVVKAVLDQRGRALYFSRACVPFIRDAEPSAPGPQPYLKHLGLYAYRPSFLRTYVTLRATPHEQAEKLEQLRALEHGHAIRVIVAPAGSCPHQGIDTPEQYAAFVGRWRARGS